MILTVKNCFSIKFIELLFLILLIAFSPAIIEAQTIDNNKFIISEIIVKENNSVGKVELLDMMGLKVGDKLDSDVITKGIKSAFLKGLFTDIKVNAAVKDKNNVQLTIEVVEREIIESIAIVGLERLRRDKIRDLFELKEGMIFYENEATNATSKLVKQIEKLGFPDVQVTTDIAKKNGTNKVKIQLIITENSPLIIKQLVIPVDKRFIGKSLGINPGDIYNEKEVKDKIQALTIKFKEKGYFRFQIKYEYIKTSEQLELDVDKGDRLEIIFNGNDNISKSDLLKETLFTELESANDIIIKESIDKLIKLYHKKGYCNVEIGYDLTNINGIIHIVFNIKEGKRYKISTVTINGSSFDNNKIKNILILKEDSIYNPDDIENDKMRLVEVYKTLGIKDITIESFETRFIEGKDKAAITITIKEGRPAAIENISIEGNILIPTEKLLSDIRIKSGNIYNEEIAMNAIHIITSQYIKLGYKDVNVTYSIENGKSDIQLNFVISEGKRYTFGSTIIKGNEMTSYKVFQNAIKHKRGDPYDYSLLLSESTILNKTGLFKSVNIKVVERPEHVMDVVFEIEEANRWVLEAGFGYAEYVGFRGFVDLGFKNIFGGNRQVRLRAEGNELSQIYSISYLEPWFLPEISFKTLVSYTHLNDENIDTGKTLYLMDKYTATSGVEHPISKTLKVTFYYEIAQVETYDVQPAAILSKEDTGTLLISSLLPSIIYDSRDNPFDPRKGTYSGMTLKFASKMLLSETDFVKISGYFNNYIGITNFLTFAFSLRSGAAFGLAQTTDLPLIERFFLGGMNTVRGFQQDQVGPKAANGTPIGGNFFCLSNVETRFDIASGFGAVLFFDIGNVWLNVTDVDFTELRKSAGIGVRYMTPVGPFRLDYGFKLDRRQGESPGEFHFNLGYAF